MIGIINYRMGNLRSVQKAFEHVGASCLLLDAPGMIDRATKLVLPGVGAFGDGMKHLDEDGWIDPIRRFIQQGGPFLGICLGMQLLMESSTEDAPATDRPISGLGLIPGRVVRFEGESFGPGKLKVPHMGWNTLNQATPHCPLWQGLPESPSVYFVHSFFAQPTQQKVTAATADYGGQFCAAIQHENILATQFHPEKSQQTGLTMLRNFARIKRS
ncbi:MAG: imidazole glycerol phosphate synthase subunit HisH [Phycisphaeraceae bacterium]|nr:imidazole glycerol phosphate synthase subunit HisH [Phycisphaeraceae bacterium]